MQLGQLCNPSAVSTRSDRLCGNGGGPRRLDRLQREHAQTEAKLHELEARVAETEQARATLSASALSTADQQQRLKQQLLALQQDKRQLQAEQQDLVRVAPMSASAACRAHRFTHAHDASVPLLRAVATRCS